MRNSACKAFILIALLFSSSVFADDQGMVSSLEDLTSEYQREGMFEAKQYRVLSVPGWLPFKDVGKVYFYKPKRNPSSAVGLDLGGVKVSVLDQTIDGDCDFDCLKSIQSKITELDNASKALIRASADELVKNAKALSDAQKTKVSDANKTSKVNTPASSTEGDSGSGDTSQQADEATSQKTDKSQSLSPDKAFEATYISLQEALAKKGVFIYRWATGSDKAAGVGLGKLLGLGGNKSEKNQGYALVSGLKIRSLIVDKDFKVPETNNNVVVTTYLMQGKHIIYSTLTDYSAYASAYLKASAAQLGDLEKTLKSLDTVEVEGRFAKLANLSNTGAMSGMTMKEEVVTTNSGKNSQSTEHWQTFYAVVTDLKDVMKALQE